MRYFLQLSYTGTNYSGWQVQKNHHSIQAEINRALSNVLRQEIKCAGASRTDAGVHALQNFAQFDSEKKLSDNFLKRVNRILPNDIAILKVVEVAADKHARHNARQRSYEYRMHFVKTPMLAGLSYLCPHSDLDFRLMKKAAALLLQNNDFSMLSRRDPDRTVVCHLSKSKWEVNSTTGQWVYHVSADRFLWGMVRRMVGVMITIGRHKISIEEFEKVMNAKGQFRVNLKAPAEGLFLTQVKYPFGL